MNTDDKIAIEVVDNGFVVVLESELYDAPKRFVFSTPGEAGRFIEKSLATGVKEVYPEVDE